MSSAAPQTDPRLAVALARAEQRRELMEQLAGMGMALVKELNQRAIETPQRTGGRDPARAFATVARAIRLTLILEAKIEKQILAWRKGNFSSIDALALPPEPFLKPRFDTGLSRRERVLEAVVAVVEREAGDPNEVERMRGRAHRSLIEEEEIDDYRLKGDFRTCVEAICSDLGLEPDWSLWDDETGFAAPAPHPPEEAGEVAHDAKRHETEGAQGRVTERPLAWLSAPSTPAGSPSPVVARATGEEKAPTIHRRE